MPSTTLTSFPPGTEVAVVPRTPATEFAHRQGIEPASVHDLQIGEQRSRIIGPSRPVTVFTVDDRGELVVEGPPPGAYYAIGQADGVWRWVAFSIAA